MSAKRPETVTHPVFGELRWDAARSVWFTQVRDTSWMIDVSVKPGDSDRLACLDRAADLYSRAIRAERQLLRTAIDNYLLELFNDNWRLADGQEEMNQGELTAEEFAARLRFEFIKVSPSSRFAVELGYDAGDMFGGHAVFVRLDRNLRYLNAALIG
jgi:hypothetical protein